jgi:5-methyltetrahydrofolate--homocysteine methyltransferase
MGILMERLATRKILVSDGAWGTMLQAQGLQSGDCCEEWNISHPEAVRSIAAAYARAGADLVLTNTFGGSRAKLSKAGHGDQVTLYNEAGARLSREGAPDCIVAASVGPTGEFLEPVGELTAEQMESIFSEQIAAILEGGVKVLCIETMSAGEEAVCAIEAARKLDPALEIIVTMTFNGSAKGFRTMMGVSPEKAARILTEAGADIIGANCGNGVEQMITIAREMRAASNRPILIHANAGLPELKEGKTVFKQTPEEMAHRVKELVEAGAGIIGGCCGTTPAHIAAIRKAVDALRCQ